MRSNSKSNRKHLDKKWKVLTEAKKYLAWNQTDYLKENKFEFICHAIGYVMGDEHYSADSSGLVKIVAQRLFPHDTYSNWLETQCSIKYWEEPNYYNKLQFSRHNWLLHLIQEFKDKDE